MIRITKTMMASTKPKKYYLNISYRDKYKTRIEIDRDTYLFLPKILKARSIQEAILYLATVLPRSPKTDELLQKVRERYDKLEERFLAERNIYVDTIYLDDLDPRTQDMLLLKRYIVMDKNTHIRVLVINPFYADSVIEIVASKSFMYTPEKYLEEKADINYLNYARKTLNLIIRTKNVKKELAELATALERYVPLVKMLRRLEHKTSGATSNIDDHVL